MLVMNAFVLAVLSVVDIALELYVWVLIIGALLSWLTAFGVINSYNGAVRAVMDFSERITAPLLRPIRKRLPPMGAVDWSPIVLLLAIYFLRSFIHNLVMRWQ